MSDTFNTSLSSNLTEPEKAEIEALEKKEAHIEQQVKDTPGLKHHGLLNPHTDDKGTPNATIHREQLDYDAGSVRERRNANQPVIPVWYLPDEDTGEVTWILNTADAEACREGYICPQCLTWQESQLDIKCKSLNGFSCGYEKGLQ